MNQIEQWLSQLTVNEKVALLAGQDAWRTVPVPRLGIRSLVFTDGPHAVCAWSRYSEGLKTTCFPTGSALGATWNPALLAEVGAALGEETRALGFDVLLGPCINIVRTPLGGRNFETFAEDPHLAGRLAVGYVRGVQSRGVGTSVKHFACNNQEIERMRGDSVVDQRTLREIYLPAFEAAVKEGRPWTVMCAYNRINGVYASCHRQLLRHILKEEWGFDGFVISDWGAVHDVFEAVRGGLDLEMPGPAKYHGELLSAALRHWQLEETDVTEAARRVLRIVERADQRRIAGRVNTPAHQRLARRAATEAITLLKNDDDLLPLLPRQLRSLAVIGPNATAYQYGGGGSSAATPPYNRQPIEELRALLPAKVRVEHAPGCDNLEVVPALSAELVRTPDGKPGFLAEYFNGERCAGKPVARRPESDLLRIWRDRCPVEGVAREQFAARWTAEFVAPGAGEFEFHLQTIGAVRLWLDGREILRDEFDSAAAGGSEFAPTEDAHACTARVTLRAGRRYRLRLEYVKRRVMGVLKVRFGRPPGYRADEQIAAAAALAQQSDAAVVFVGMPHKFETEGGDRPHMRLPGRQDDLVRAVLAANPRTVVVVNAGSPVTMPWAADAPAILFGWYGGQEGGAALARVLLGRAEPSGRLPVSFPARYEDNPTFPNYPGERQATYGEGVFVGYRYYDAKQVAPLFPFGHGLSYTSFAYRELRLPRTIQRGQPARVSVVVENTGPRPGTEVVQLYVGDVKCRLPRPVRELKGFAKITLRPGEKRRVEFVLGDRDWSFYDPVAQAWRAEPGEFVVAVGRSSRDLPVAGRFTLV